MAESAMADSLQRLEGPAPVAEVAIDMIKRGAVIAPVLIFGGAAIWGTPGAASVAFGLALILVNFAFAAYLLAAGARISFAMMGAAALFGFLIRFSLLFLAVFLVKDASWVELMPLCLTIIVSHLGLLFWEMRYVSASLAYPGLKPKK